MVKHYENKTIEATIQRSYFGVFGFQTHQFFIQRFAIEVPDMPKHSNILARNLSRIVFHHKAHKRYSRPTLDRKLTYNVKEGFTVPKS